MSKLTGPVVGELDVLADELIGEGWHYGSDVCHEAKAEIERLRKIETVALIWLVRHHETDRFVPEPSIKKNYHPKCAPAGTKP